MLQRFQLEKVQLLSKVDVSSSSLETPAIVNNDGGGETDLTCAYKRAISRLVVGLAISTFGPYFLGDILLGLRKYDRQKVILEWSYMLNMLPMDTGPDCYQAVSWYNIPKTLPDEPDVAYVPWYRLWCRTMAQCHTIYWLAW